MDKYCKAIHKKPSPLKEEPNFTRLLILNTVIPLVQKYSKLLCTQQIIKVGPYHAEVDGMNSPINYNHLHCWVSFCSTGTLDGWVQFDIEVSYISGMYLCDII